MKLALGTVQFGLPYGIANPGGQIGRDDAGQILALARESGIDTLDTAIAYGDSEACLGAVGTKGFRVITKLPA
ncbi:MAG: aldo/keto reductase, partial [Rhodanobacter sp.]